MPNTKSAKKELRKSNKLRQVNQKVKANLKNTLKTNLKKVENKDKSVKDDLPKIIKEIDKAVKKRLIKPGNAARKKSRLVKKINKIN